MKAVLVIDMPFNCRACPLKTSVDGLLNYCFVGEALHVDTIFANNRLKSCPLRPLPQKVEMDLNEYYKGVADGWNDCIDSITGETE